MLRKNIFILISEKLANAVQCLAWKRKNPQEKRFALLGGSNSHRCDYCRCQTHTRVIPGNDPAWNGASWLTRMFTSLTEHVCFDDGCAIYGRPRTYRCTFLGMPEIYSPRTTDAIIYRHNDANISFQEGTHAIVTTDFKFNIVPFHYNYSVNKRCQQIAESWAAQKRIQM